MMEDNFGDGEKPTESLRDINIKLEEHIRKYNEIRKKVKKYPKGHRELTLADRIDQDKLKTQMRDCLVDETNYEPISPDIIKERLHYKAIIPIYNRMIISKYKKLKKKTEAILHIQVTE